LKPGPSPHFEEDQFGVEILFSSWDEFFDDCERWHENGVPYRLLNPDPGTVKRLGAMPTPPWERPQTLEDEARSE